MKKVADRADEGRSKQAFQKTLDIRLSIFYQNRQSTAVTTSLTAL